MSRGDEVVPALNRCIAAFRDRDLPVFASRDWHPPRTKHFQEDGGPWPPHCVQGTDGAAFYPDLALPADAAVLTKGTDPDEDAYSVFQAVDGRGRPFAEVLREGGIDRLYVGGLATDYCVLSSVLDARFRGIEIELLTDAIRAVDVTPGDGERALRRMKEAGARPTSTEEAIAAVSKATSH